MTEKSQPRERSRLGLTPSVVTELGLPLLMVFFGVLAMSIQLALVMIGAMLIVLVLGFLFPRSSPYWHRHRPATRVVLIAQSVFLAIVWVALAVFHWNNPRFP